VSFVVAASTCNPKKIRQTIKWGGQTDAAGMKAKRYDVPYGVQTLLAGGKAHVTVHAGRPILSAARNKSVFPQPHVARATCMTYVCMYVCMYVSRVLTLECSVYELQLLRSINYKSLCKKSLTPRRIFLQDTCQFPSQSVQSLQPMAAQRSLQS
jgi:hypothetical protein